MQHLLTVRLIGIEARSLDMLCSTTGRSRSDIVRDALRAYRLRESLRQSQAALTPLARAAGWLVSDPLVRAEVHEVLKRKFAAQPKACALFDTVWHGVALIEVQPEPAHDDGWLIRAAVLAKVDFF